MTDCSLQLKGLGIASPQSFMAALGLLRVCSEDLAIDARLSWSSGHACISGVTRETLLASLAEHMRGRALAPEFNFEVILDKGGRGAVGKLNTIRPEDYRTVARSFTGDSRAQSFLAAFASDCVLSEKGHVASCRLDFSSGQQQFMSAVRELAGLLNPELSTFEPLVQNALFGGPYISRNKLSFGWDPVAVKRHANEAVAPTDVKPSGQPFCIWLAVESLPLHPLLPASPTRAMTVGLSREGYVWPEWGEPLTLDEVRLLRQRPVNSLAELQGIVAIWKSAIASSGKYQTFSGSMRTSGYREYPKGFALP